MFLQGCTKLQNILPFPVWLTTPYICTAHASNWNLFVKLIHGKWEFPQSQTLSASCCHVQWHLTHGLNNNLCMGFMRKPYSASPHLLFFLMDNSLPAMLSFTFQYFGFLWPSLIWEHEIKTFRGKEFRSCTHRMCWWERWSFSTPSFFLPEPESSYWLSWNPVPMFKYPLFYLMMTLTFQSSNTRNLDMPNRDTGDFP